MPGKRYPALLYMDRPLDFVPYERKKNFFTFGEVWGSEEQIAHFIGRNAMSEGKPIGVDAALDYPLFYKLLAVVKGSSPPPKS